MMARTNVLSALALSVAFAAEADVRHVFREPYHDLLVSAAGLADVRTTVELNDGWSGEVKKDNPIGRTLVWKLDDDHHEATYGSGEFKVERLNAEGKIEMRLPLQVNAGWYVIMYRMDGVELVATEWR